MSSPTAIKSVQFFRAVSPSTGTIADSTHQISSIAFIVTRIELNNGIVGEAYLLSFHYSPNAIAGALRDVAEMAAGFEVSQTGKFIEHYERESEYFGNEGIHRSALGSINVAMWDAWGKHLQQPIWKLLGSCGNRVRLYGSGGWLSYSDEELLDEVKRYIGRGFRGVKIKVGSTDIQRDIERLTRVREAIGPSNDVMMDANQGMNLASAMRLAEAVRLLRITWFEEPLSHRDFAGYRQLRQHAGLSLAIGEREFDSTALRELISRDAIDLWQPDLLRLGSVEAWRASAALAGAHNIPVLPHYYKEYDVPLLMTVPNAFGAESFDWVDPLITHPIRMENGFAYPTDRPGWGFSFKEQFLTQM